MVKGIKYQALLQVFLIFSFTGLFSQGSWEKIDLPVTEWLRTVHFTDSLYGWAAGNNGMILHTQDGGGSWVIQDGPTQNNIADIFFLDRDRGWASSFNFTQSPYGTILLKTTDGGDNWTQEPYPEENIFINCILYLDELNGWMGGSPHALVRTTDGGQTWQQASIDTATLAFFPVLKIVFCNDNYGYASGGMFDIAGVIWRTWDGGDHWYVIDVSDAPADEVRGLHCFDSLNVLGAGGDPDFGYGVGVIRTDNGGLDWNYTELGYQGNCYDLDFVSDTEAWAPLGPRRKFIYSTDAGEKWIEIPTPDSTVILDVCFPDSLHGFAVGPEGAMLKYTPPVPVSIPEFQPEKNAGILKIFPNPFTTSASIHFTLPAASFRSGSHANAPPFHVMIHLYDLLGNRLSTLADADFPPGNHTVKLDASALKAGVFFCRILVEQDQLLYSESHRIMRMR